MDNDVTGFESREPTNQPPPVGVPRVIKPRDALNTRQLLLRAARARFARDGYSATTVRDIAADAGVNVALINRYFASKEGLFEACLARAAEDLGGAVEGDVTLDRILHTIVTQIATSPTGDGSLQLLLLLRSSGDESADLIRRNTLETFARRMALATEKAEEVTDELLLRAEVVIAAGLGMALLRSSTGLEPLTSATTDQLAGPVADLVSALLGPERTAAHASG